MMKQVLKFIFTVPALLWSFAIIAQTDVLTQHNNVSRTGWNNTETQLTTANVKDGSFGLLGTHTVDEQIYAQPLVASGVSINGTATNVVYVASVNNTIYAFNADNITAPVIWQRNLTNAGYRPPYNTDMTRACYPGTYSDFQGAPGGSNHGTIGIVGTPVIDKASNTMWLVHREVDPNQIDQPPPSNPNVDEDYMPTGFRQYLHAIDIRTGAEKPGSPVLITAQVAGTGPGNVNGVITFDARKENQRGGLLLMNGAIYIPYAAHCDWNNYYGWVLAYDASSLQQRTAWVSGPNDGRGGVWMSGAGITADPTANGGNGSLYLASGNSNGANPSVKENRGESVIKLNPNGQGNGLTQLGIADYFTPFDFNTLNAQDLDFGTQTMLIPNTNLLIAGCKDHYLYVFDKTNMGGYNSGGNGNLQKILVSSNAAMHTAFAYFAGTTHKYFYQFSENSNLKAYPVTGAGLGTPVDGVGNGPTGQAGSVLAGSSNGADESTAILWVSHAVNSCNANQEACPGVLRAVNAADVTSQLWSSTTQPGDAVGYFAKNACPTIANGKVYIATISNKLNIYGLLDNNPLCKTNVALTKTYSESGGNAANAGNAFDGNTGTSWTSTNVNAWVQVDLGAAYDICKIGVIWSGADDAGKNFDLQVANNPGGPWTTIETVTGNTAVTTDYTGTYPSSRYVRLQGVAFGNNPDYQLAEFQVFGTLTPTCTPPATVTVSNVTQTGATVNWSAVATANSYQLKYRPSAINSWITRNTTNLTQALSQLSCGTDYTVDLQSICATGSSTTVKEVTFTSSACTTPCPLTTRYNNADIGDIPVAGSSCYDVPSTTFTVIGSGNIGANNDIFQFAYTNLAGDESYDAKMQSLTNLPGAKGGIMMRDSLSDTSPFVFLGMNNGAGIQFMYRTVSGGPTTVVQGPVVTLPYYLRIVKTGTNYAAFTSANNTTWTEFTNQNAGFGTSTVYPGMAVSSASNSQAATGAFQILSESSPLPITLVDFTGKNVDNKYITLQWTTLNEQNNDKFVLEHSSDGVHFVTLTTVKAAGDSDTLRRYNAVDNQPFNGANYYRLVQFDLDGRQTVLPVIMVNFGTGISPVVYPNPVNDYVNIIGGDEPITRAALYDITGRKIRETKNTDNRTTVKIPTAGLPKGIYMLKTVTTTKTYQQKIMKP